MNHNQKTVDALLRSVTPPNFVNERHQDALRLRLKGILAEESTLAPRFSFGPRTVKALAAYGLAAVMVVALILGVPFFTAKSVWAQAISAMERVQTAVVTFRFLAPEGAAAPPEAAAEQRAYMQAPNRYALITPGRKGWFNGSEILVYDPDINQVTQMTTPGNVTGQLLDMFSSGHFPYRLFAPQYDHESDRGVVDFEGKPLYFIELWDSRDPTDKLEFYLEPDTLLPVTQITWHRDDESAAWRQALRADYAFNVPVDPQVFVPDYPSTAKVVHQEPPAATQPAVEETQSTEWQNSALAIARHGDKYVAITDVWMGEAGWIGIKVRSNLYTVMEYPLNVEGLPGFIEDPANQQRWNADEKTLRQYLFGGQLSSDEGLIYLSSNGATRSPHNRVSGDKEFSQFYSPYPTPPDVVYPKTVTFRFLTNVTDKGRGEKWEHYQDWKSDPQKYQLFELTVPVPAPSNIPPVEFKEWDLEYWARTGVDSQAFQSLIAAMRNAGRDAEVYDRFHELPDERLLPLGVTWLTLLDNLGKEQEKKAYFDKYEPYAVKMWGDKAEELGNLKLCREIMARVPKP